MSHRSGAVADVVMVPDPSAWRGRRVLLTGHTGFKGGWIAIRLAQLGAEVTELALAPSTTPDLFSLARIADGLAHRECDVRDRASVADVVCAPFPGIVLHLAAQPPVRASYADPLATFATNVMGTARLFNACRTAQACG